MRQFSSLHDDDKTHPSTINNKPRRHIQYGSGRRPDKLLSAEPHRRSIQLSTRPVYPPTNHNPPMSIGGSLLRGDYSTKSQLCPRDCGGASLELWICCGSASFASMRNVECLLQASRVPHPAAGCSVGRLAPACASTGFCPPSTL